MIAGVILLAIAGCASSSEVPTSVTTRVGTATPGNWAGDDAEIRLLNDVRWHQLPELGSDETLRLAYGSCVMLRDGHSVPEAAAWINREHRNVTTGQGELLVGAARDNLCRDAPWRYR